MSLQPPYAASAALKMLSSETVTRQVLRDLRRAIVTLELPPGTRLSEADIAQRYGVSRQPVREALIGLSSVGLVDVKPQRGSVVVKFSTSHMLDVRFIREAIEVAVVRRACASFDPNIRLELDDIVRQQRRALVSSDTDLFHSSDERFHMALARGAGCSLAWQTIEDIKVHMDRICRLTLLDATAIAPLVAQHEAILGAIDLRDAEAATAVMQEHLAEILKALPRLEQEHPHLFE
jgi:DNA-binding GntR family transcriptional regulator